MHIYTIGVSQDPGTRHILKLKTDSEVHDGHWSQLIMNSKTVLCLQSLGHAC